MQLLLITKDRQIERRDNLEAIPEDSFVWIDAARSEPAEPWRDLAEDLTGIRVFDAHMIDAANESHPSFFDNTSDYEVVIFRGLSASPESIDDEKSVRLGSDHTYAYGPINTRPFRVKTAPIVFFLLPRLVITVRPDEAPSIGQVRARLLSNAARAPVSPEELAHRVLNAMVDRYLELRLPMAERLDRWQRNLLDPRRPFNDWHALLDQRIEIRKLEHLCEEQRDAIQEWRDHRYENLSDVMSVRINDLLEHIARVLGHAQRLEQTAESAVQLHFSATAHRTNEIMRTLTILTAIFMPLTLITGIFGMNFKEMPWLEWHLGFWTTMGLMSLLALCLMLYFRSKRYIERSDRPRRPLTSQDL
ncbi:MAG TPA: magnesium transporter CorA family protein [Burkholderiales bacterium]|jgi:magnesium/cobalt transport protein CorA